MDFWGITGFKGIVVMYPLNPEVLSADIANIRSVAWVIEQRLFLLSHIKCEWNLVLKVPFGGSVPLCPAAVLPAGRRVWWLYWCPLGLLPGCSSSGQTGGPSPRIAQTAPAGMPALVLEATDTIVWEERKRLVLETSSNTSTSKRTFCFKTSYER